MATGPRASQLVWQAAVDERRQPGEPAGADQSGKGTTALALLRQPGTPAGLLLDVFFKFHVSLGGPVGLTLSHLAFFGSSGVEQF